MAEYEALRLRHVDLFRAMWPAYLHHLDWSAEALRDYQEAALRGILRTAKQRSPWYRKRLAHIDTDTATEAVLATIPPMSKNDLMANFDDILTDRRLSLDLVETHLAGLTDDSYLLDEFHAVASGGSSGTRGVFVYGWEAWAHIAILTSRFRLRHEAADPEIGPGAVRAILAAGKATHVSFAVSRTFREIANATPINATLPLHEIVERLNTLQPAIFQGYPSILNALTGETAAGRLHVVPQLVVPLAEPLLPEMKRAMEQAWHAPILNHWGTSEGAFAAACGQGRGMHLGADFTIFEMVDNQGHAVVSGTRAAKMYITNLYNPAQPLIRYEVTDEVTVIDEPCPCGCVMQRIDDIEGRLDDTFVYAGGTSVHPLLFRSRLGAERNVVEYQVRQTADGAHIALRVQGPVDIEGLGARLAGDLEHASIVCRRSPCRSCSPSTASRPES